MKAMGYTRFFQRVATAALVMIAAASPAAAHVGVGDAHGLTHGFMHPIGGLDHILFGM